MKWGDRYGPEWVNRLYAMVERNTTWNIRFVCLTDNCTGIRTEVECLPLPEVYFDENTGIYWPKLGMFERRLHDLEGMTLYLDLDLIVLDNIDCFFEFDGRFCMVREWKDAHLGFGNSSIVRFFAGLESRILDKFYEISDEEIMTAYSSKEQNFVSRNAEGLVFWPDDWCPSFAGTCLPRNRVARFFATPKPPEKGKILVFFGSITPAAALLGQHEPRKRVRQSFSPRLTRQRFRPAPWISSLWRE
jgi:hypothetical protein